MDEILLRHMDDLAERAKRTGVASSKFLTPAEQTLVRRHFTRRGDVALDLVSGFERAPVANVGEGAVADAINGARAAVGTAAGADTDSSIGTAAGADDHRRVAVLLEPDWGAYDASELLRVFRIDYRDQFAIGHRDILGALMALGVEREVLGDIVAGESPAYLVCLAEIAPFIASNVGKIGRVGVSLTAVPLSELPAREEKLLRKTVTCASLRLDALVGAGFGLPREKAAALISGGLLALNHAPCEKPDQKVGEGDLMSVRGYGRARVLSVGGASRKGRIFVELGLTEK
ncbi:MAG: hypothetical protein LBU58_10800 [Clostridiales bacterium]|jgi:RNA-binding protein YlmH|nr:hypothetical protein [Clostridiales bacterium]